MLMLHQRAENSRKALDKSNNNKNNNRYNDGDKIKWIKNQVF
ncbi:hypothetical protein DERF_001552 [Dermatophagoides farinae]|uniref:Uncharacterized protein n=1 Tax=Dermatophagoides farinae TaxID=6954 RepID=A0A922L9R7_DERFA|nr:hypothetical protein DERF_001552 [Dermatophagoides farinae]